MSPFDALASVWSLGALPEESLGQVALSGSDPVFPSSFAVGAAAQATTAAAALAACAAAAHAQSASETGSAATYMNGWRRPHVLRVLSEICPTSGSTKASKISANMIAVDTMAGGRPMTWL